MTDLFQQAIKEAYASASVEDMILHTLELNHSTFPEPIRVVRDFGILLEASSVYGGLDIYGRTLTLEDTAPVEPSEAVRFVGMHFELELPAQAQNRLPELQIRLDNVTQDVAQYLDAAVEVAEPISLIYREYLLNSPTVVQFKLEGLNIHKVTSSTSMVVMTAVFEDLTNKAFPDRLYRPDEFPGLIQ
jgi:hypothetical protein